MTIAASEQLEGKKITKTIGMVRGSTIRARHIGRDVMAELRGVVGGEITEYSKMMAESREQAIQRMAEDTEKQGANTIIGMRFLTSMAMSNASETLVYGTAVVVE